MTRINIAFNPYTITWVEFVPASGIATKHDINILDPIAHARKGSATHFKHFPTKQAALDFLASIDANRLDKSYTCYLCNDKQFGMAQNGKVKYTKIQLASPVIISK